MLLKLFLTTTTIFDPIYNYQHLNLVVISKRSQNIRVTFIYTFMLSVKLEERTAHWHFFN